MVVQVYCKYCKAFHIVCNVAVTSELIFDSIREEGKHWSGVRLTTISPTKPRPTAFEMTIIGTNNNIVIFVSKDSIMFLLFNCVLKK